MEETDMCVDPTTTPVVPAITKNASCPAKALEPGQRQQLAVQALAGTQSITDLAADLEVSRKFVYRQAAVAAQALQGAFTPPNETDDAVLFHLPVTKSWLRQVVLGLTLCCHSSHRGVVEFCRDLFDYPISVGTVHNILQDAVAAARATNQKQDLSSIAIGAHDEIFQAGRPVLVGVDTFSSYCYLLNIEEQRDAETWGVCLLDLQQQGFAPEAVVADAACGLRAGQKLALPGVPCRSDVFHALHEVAAVVKFLENRAYQALNACLKLEQRQARDARSARFSRKLATDIQHAHVAQAKAVALFDDVAELARWLRHDILSLAGPSHAERLALYDFLLVELKARSPEYSHRLDPLVSYLKNQRDDLLAFAAQLDRDLTALAATFEIPVPLVRELLAVHCLAPDLPQRYRREASLRRQLGDRHFALSQAVEEIRRRTVRASSVVENLNSRLRSYFFLRRHLGADYLHLLQFFLNHRRFQRSEHPDRIDKSPVELLTGQSQAHWLETLGYQRFACN
jgi:hypothetical protein